MGGNCFTAGVKQMFVVAVETDPTFVPGAQELLFHGDYDRDAMGVREIPFYDISPDGQRFVMTQSPPGEEITSVRVVLNWFEELRERVPIP